METEEIMDKTIEATFDGEVFRPNEPVDLKPNTKLRLELSVKKSKKSGKPHSFLDYAMSIDLGLPSDYSANIDDYLYGGKSLSDE